ncbi:hypothetical protein CANMA_005412 [Candida margitis]|uniref:uncharacterized protein n=1 Tax=Candida margitis TaxID=1775924 RepID=UPI002227A87E|nr:uncharacterized protein CANMA_005412 [Candida margitis]KAI5949832.1 hypothetical protein CANMA_005412 [Candida margitis]
MTLTILDLGEDILTYGISRYLSPDDIFKFFALNSTLYKLFQTSPTIYQLLYNKKFTNNENNYTLSLQQHLNWKQLWQLRCDKNQQVFTWGESNGGRLGYLSTRIDQSHVSRKLGGWSVHIPTNIPEFNRHLVVDLKANGYSFVILLNNGELWFTGMDWKRPQQGLSTPGPVKSKDYKPNPGTMALSSMNNNAEDTVGGRRSIIRGTFSRGGGRTGVMPMPISGRYTHDGSSESDEDGSSTQEGSSSSNTQAPPSTTAPAPAPAPETSSQLPQSRRRLQPSESRSALRHPPSKIQETNFLSRLFLPPINGSDDRKIISISTGREHIVALDDQNNVYTWDSGCNSNIGIHIQFHDIREDSNIVKVAAGWNLSACQIDTVGLVVWYSREPLTKVQFDQQNYQSRAKYLIIPGTENNVVDFTVGTDYVLFIKKSDSTLHQFRVNAHDLSTRDDESLDINDLKRMVTSMDNFNDWISQQEQSVQFTRLNSCYTNFVVFTNHDQVLIGSKAHLLYHISEEEGQGKEPVVIPDLQGQSIKSIEIGDYHYLALTNDGSLLSWGTESRSCGCLGIGPRELAVSENVDNVVERGVNLEVKRPMHVKNPLGSRVKGKWVAVAASGWQSGGIYVPLEE